MNSHTNIEGPDAPQLLFAFDLNPVYLYLGAIVIRDVAEQSSIEMHDIFTIAQGYNLGL